MSEQKHYHEYGVKIFALPIIAKIIGKLLTLAKTWPLAYINEGVYSILSLCSGIGVGWGEMGREKGRERKKWGEVPPTQHDLFRRNSSDMQT